MYVKIIRNGCPLCKGRVGGNNKIRYICVNCKISFKYSQLASKEIEEVKTDDSRIKELFNSSN